MQLWARIGTQGHAPGVRQRTLGVACVLAAATALLLARPHLAELLARPPAPVFVQHAVSLHGEGTARTARGVRVSSVQRLRIRADMIGASWTGSGDAIELRVRGGTERWSRWVRLAAAPYEGPDASSPEGRASAGRRFVPVPTWVGDARDVQVRTPRGGAGINNLRIAAINASGSATSPDRVRSAVRRSAALVLGTPRHDRATAAPGRPTIVTRAEWGADESYRRGDPTYFSTVRGAVVHHTDNLNTYAPEDAAAMVRGIYIYHVKSNGWNDVGYNFLIDRYGVVYEGRYGGVTQPVLGAHTLGFNTGTVGMALLGNHVSDPPTPAAQAALTSLMSWRLDVSHVVPTGDMRLTSAAGQTVVRRAVSGHRDLFATACPGTTAYSLIDTVRQAAWASDGPKFGNPTATPRTAPDTTATGSSFAALGNTTLDWHLSIHRIPDGALVYEHTSTGASFTHDWAGTSRVGPVSVNDLRWTLEASSGGVAATPYAAPMGATPPPVAVSLAAPAARYVTPNDDGLGEKLTTSLTLNTPAKIDLQVVDRADPFHVIGTVWAGRALPAGTTPTIVSGMLPGKVLVPDGTYTLVAIAHDPVEGRAGSTASRDFSIDRRIRFPRIERRFSPNGDHRGDTVRVRATVIGAPMPLAIQVRTKTHRVVRTLYRSGSATGPISVRFDGRRTSGRNLPAGRYEIVVRSPRPDGVLLLSRPVYVDRAARGATHRPR